MTRIKVDPGMFEALGEMLAPPPPKKQTAIKEWSPSLNPVQQQIFDSDVRNILAWGEKGSGKSIAGYVRL